MAPHPVTLPYSSRSPLSRPSSAHLIISLIGSSHSILGNARWHEFAVIHRSRHLVRTRADVYVDPWKGVDRAIITHAHSDHARAAAASAPRAYTIAPKQLIHAPHREGLVHRHAAVGAARHHQWREILVPSCRAHAGSVQVRVEYKERSGWPPVTSNAARQHQQIPEPVPCHTFYRMRLRTADLPMEGADPCFRGYQRVVARQCRNRCLQHCQCLQLGQGATYNEGRGQQHRPGVRRARRRGEHERGAPERRS